MMNALQQLVVCAHYGCAFVDNVRARLSDHERAMFDNVDARAFRADSERRARALVAVADELPQTIAKVGIDDVRALFDDEAVFLPVVRGERVLAVAFAHALEARAGDVARVEGAIARARRPRIVGAVGRRSGVEVTRTSDGAMIATLEVNGSVSLSSCATALCDLLASPDGEHADFIARARMLGCDSDDEANELLDDLIGEGLLVRSHRRT